MKKNDVKIKVNTENRQVYFNDNFLGVNAENLQSDLIFEFDGEFVNGSPRVEVELDGSKYIITEISKVGNTYVMPIKSSLLTTTQIYMQLVITESGDSEIPIFKSRRFYLIVEESINASTELPDEYQTLYDQIEEKIAEVNNLNVTGERVSDGVEVTITDKQGVEHTTKVNDGIKGERGEKGEKGDTGERGPQGIQGETGPQGDTYEITEEDYDVIENQVKTDIQPILQEIENTSKQAEIIAKGRATGYVFDTVEDLDNWLLVEENVSKLVLGDNLYIRAVGVPDYWWDGTSKQVLETEKPDLTEYAKKEQFVTLTQAEYDALTEKSANTYYFIIEEE